MESVTSAARLRQPLFSGSSSFRLWSQGFVDHHGLSRLDRLQSLAMPKSVSTIWLSWSMRILSGLMSRWMTRKWWRCSRATSWPSYLVSAVQRMEADRY